MRLVRFALWAFVWFAVLLCVVWATGALYFDFPVLGEGLAVGFVIVSIVAAAWLRGNLRKLSFLLGAFIIVLFWWLTLKPTNNRAWQPDMGQTAWAEIKGDLVDVHNVRNCEYRGEHDFITRWETRRVRLSQISGIDLAITFWGSAWIAHPIMSFRFQDANPLCFSIETRKAIGQSYSAVRGLYRQYTLIYVVADERDLIRVRSNYRRGEDVYLYRMRITPADARALFLEYIATVNSLHENARWYNAVTANCTTSIREQRPAHERMPWDWRMLLNGKSDELLYERKLIATGGLSFAELKKRSWINERARAADHESDFSRLIRVGLPQSD